MTNAYEENFEKMKEEIRIAKEAYEQFLEDSDPAKKEKAIFNYTNARTSAEFCYENGPNMLRQGFRNLIKRIDARLSELKKREIALKPPGRPKGLEGAMPLVKALENIPEDLRAIIQSTIVAGINTITLNEIAGLEFAKRALEEAVKLPLVRPDLFTGSRYSWKGVLLFGPPGCGKTLLAKAVSGDSNATFFNVSAAELVSKWLGEGEKIAKELFKLAREVQPSIVFFDEVDAIAKTRNIDEHDAVQRMKTIIMQEMSGLNSQKDELVVIIGATNVPWAIDSAIRRRFEKRIYVPLPDESARIQIFKMHTKGVELDATVDFSELAKVSEGYSGADISIVCREALMTPIRELRDQGRIEDFDAKPRLVTFKDFSDVIFNTGLLRKIMIGISRDSKAVGDFDFLFSEFLVHFA